MEDVNTMDMSSITQSEQMHKSQLHLQHGRGETWDKVVFSGVDARLNRMQRKKLADL